MQEDTYSVEKALFDCIDSPLHPVSIRRIFLLLLRSHFSDPAHFMSLKDDIGCLKWSEDAKERTLEIDLDNIFSDTSEGTDGITLDVAQFQFRRKVIDNRGEGNDDGSGFEYTQQIDCMLHINHVRPNADQSYILATETATFLFGVRDPLIRRLGLAGMEVLEIQPAKLISGNKPERHFSVVVSVSLLFNFSVQTNVEGHRIKKFATRVSASAS